MRGHNESEWEHRKVLRVCCINDQIRPIPRESSQGPHPQFPSLGLIAPAVCLLIILCLVTPHFLEEQRSGWPWLHQNVCQFPRWAFTKLMGKYARNKSLDQINETLICPLPVNRAEGGLGKGAGEGPENEAACDIGTRQVPTPASPTAATTPEMSPLKGNIVPLGFRGIKVSY